MAGCSKKQYAIMMSAGSEGKKLASEMGSMDQDKFNAAFEELLGKGNGGDYKKDEDEDYRDFDENKDDDFGFDDEEEKLSDDEYGYGQTHNFLVDKNKEMQEKEPNPMDEFSGPDREGPSYAQLDDLKKYADRYGYNFDEIKNEFDRRVKYAKEKQGFYSDKDAMSVAFESLTDDMVEANGKDFINKSDATTYNGAEVIGGDDDNEGMLKDKTPLTEEQSKAIGKKKYHPVDSEGNILDEEGIEAANEEEAFNIASKKFPGRGDELQVQEAEDKGLSLEGAIKSADDDVLDSQFGKDSPERKLAGGIKGASIPSDYKEKGKSTWNQKLQKGDKVVIKDNEGNDLEGYIYGFWSRGDIQDEDTYEEGKDNLWHDFRGLHLVDKDGKHIGDINANQILKHERPQKEPDKLNYSPEMKKVKNAIKGLALDSKEERRKLLLQMLDEIDNEEK